MIKAILHTRNDILGVLLLLVVVAASIIYFGIY